MQNISSHTTFNHNWLRPTRKPLLLAVIFNVVLATTTSLSPTAIADSRNAAADCVKVGGAFVTNFIAPDQTAGAATGDLKGALGVKVLGVVSGSIGNGKPVTLKVQHFWVTETGDTLLAQEAEVTAYPGTSPSQPLLYSFVYEKGIKITGGTGKFEGANALLTAWGGIDLGAGEVAGRYAGTVCFKTSSQH
ncbi:MAG: hypothetical protein U1G07_24820 [Verrucomicrobiota bacterium]